MMLMSLDTVRTMWQKIMMVYVLLEERKKRIEWLE